MHLCFGKESRFLGMEMLFWSRCFDSSRGGLEKIIQFLAVIRQQPPCPALR